MARNPHSSAKGPSVSIQHHGATQAATLVGHDQHERPARNTTPGKASVAMVTAAMAFTPAAFWAAIAWFLWGRLAAAIVTIVVLVMFVVMMGLLRSAAETETPEVTPRRDGLRRAA